MRQNTHHTITYILFAYYTAQPEQRVFIISWRPLLIHTSNILLVLLTEAHRNSNVGCFVCLSARVITLSQSRNHPRSLQNRTDVQCQHRWQKVLNPELIKGPWTKEEDQRVRASPEHLNMKNKNKSRLKDSSETHRTHQAYGPYKHSYKNISAERTGRN